MNKSANAEKLLQLPEENVEERLVESLEENSEELPLLDMCMNGSSPSIDGAEVHDLQITQKTSRLWSGQFYASVMEESPAGCRDATWTERVTERIRFAWARETGGMEFETDQIRREFDPDEFYGSPDKHPNCSDRGGHRRKEPPVSRHLEIPLYSLPRVAARQLVYYTALPKKLAACCLHGLDRARRKWRVRDF